MARCIQSVKAMSDFDYLDEKGREVHEAALAKYIHDVGYIMAVQNGEDDHFTGNAVLSAAEGDRYINMALGKIMGKSPTEIAKAVEGGSDMWKHVIEASPEQRAQVIKTLDRHVEMIYRAIDNPDKVRQLAFDSCRIKSILNHCSTQEAWSNKISAKTKNMIALIGGKHPVYENKITALQQWDPSRKMFMMLNEIDAYTERQGKLHISELNKAFTAIAKTDILKRNGVTVAQLSAMMEYFSGLKDGGDVDKHYSKFIDFAVERGLLDNQDIDDQVAKGLYRKIYEGAGAWWKLNYGNSNVDMSGAKANEYEEKNGIRYWKHTEGVTGYFNDLRNKFNDVFLEYKDAIAEHGRVVGSKDNAKDKAILDFFNRLQGHMFKDNYVPMSRDTEFIEDFSKTDEEFRVWYADWMFKSKDDEDSTDKIDFLKNVQDNVLTTNMIFKKFTNLVVARTLQAKIDVEATKGEGNWFSSQGRQDVRIGVQSLIDDLNLLADYDSGRQSVAARVTKTVGNTMQTFIGSFLGFPGSSLNNYIGLGAAILLRVGKGVSGVEYNDAMKNTDNPYHDIAKQIDAYAEKWLISSGMPQEFLSYASADKGHGDFIDRTNLALGKIGDFNAKGGLIGMISKTYRKIATVAGSEEVGRKLIKRYMFNQVLAGVELLKMGNEGEIPKEQLDVVIKDASERSWYEFTSAMGLFSGVNKSFYFHTRSDTAETAPAAMAGMLLKVWNSFRHVAVTGFDNYIKSGIDIGYNLRREGISATVAAQGALGFGVIPLTILSLAMSLLKDHDDIIFSPLNALNPIDNPIAGVRMLATQAACLLGANVSEENYKMAMADGLNFYIGAAGGRYVSDKYTKEADNMISFFNNPITSVYDVISNGEIAGGSGKAYEARQKLRDSFGFLMASDPIFLAERLVELGFIRSTDPNVTRAVQLNTGKATLSTILGLSLYAAPYFQKKANRQYGNDVKSERHLSYLRSGRGHRNYIKNLYSRDVTDRAEYSLENYGSMPKRGKV